MNVGPKGIPWKGATTPRSAPSGTSPSKKPAIRRAIAPFSTAKPAVPQRTSNRLEKIRSVNGCAQAKVWEPGDTWDSERLVVAAQADNIGGVGLAESWGKMDAFHAANPMGQFRFQPARQVVQQEPARQPSGFSGVVSVRNGDWLAARATVRAPAGAFLVTVLPPPTVPPAPMVTGATSTQLLPTWTSGLNHRAVLVGAIVVGVMEPAP